MLPKDYRLEFVPRKAGTSVRDVLALFVDKRPKVDVLVVGCVGRKGPKEDPSILGSTTDSSLRAVPCNCLVVKRRPEITNEPSNFMACIDGSPQSIEGFHLLCRMARKGDTVYLVHFDENSDDGTSKVVEACEAAIKIAQETCEAVCVCRIFIVLNLKRVIYNRR